MTASGLRNDLGPATRGDREQVRGQRQAAAERSGGRLPRWGRRRGGGLPWRWAMLVSCLWGMVAGVQGQGWEPGASGPGDGAETTLSPYFLIPGQEEGAEQFPLKATRVRGHVSGVIADVTIEQEYQNRGTEVIDAIYVFPGSTRAAVHGLTLEIGERRIEAQIQERQAARRTYEAARTEGKTASLLEQHRPNVFQMNVANIVPGDTVKVRLRYTELLVPEDQQYEFVFPTLVGPRYSNESSAGAPPEKRWSANPFLQKGVDSSAAFDFELTVDAGMPIQEAVCLSHGPQPTFESPAQCRLKLDGAASANRDVVMHFRLAGQQVAAGLLVHQDPNAGADGDRYFLMMAQPPRRVPLSAVPPREYVFIVDVSGSMAGFPLDTAKGLVRELAKGMRPQDRFNVLLFAGGSQLLSPASLPATPGNIQNALATLDGMGGGGGTELLPALRRALALPGAEDGVSRMFVVVTDGFVTVEREAFDLIRSQLGRANVFAFGIGSSVNRHLIESLAKAGQGEPWVVLDPSSAPGVAEAFRKTIELPVLTRLEVRGEGIELLDLEPPAIPDVLRDRPVVVFGKWRAAGGRGRVVLRGQTAGGPFEQAFELDPGAASEQPGLRYLWARARIAALSDFGSIGSEEERAVTELGLKFNLLTQFTSFVAVDETVRASRGDGTTREVTQPLPLPAGVENSAVAGAPSVPEPGALLMLALCGAALFWAWPSRGERRLRWIGR